MKATTWLLAALGLLFAASVAADPPTARSVALRVAVLEFENASSDRQLDSLGKGLQAMLVTDLSLIDSLTLVERARLKEIEAELKLGSSRAIDQATAAKIGKLAGASHMLTGTFTVLGEKMRLDCRLFAVSDGTITLAEKIEGDKAAFFELEKGLVQKLITVTHTTVAPKAKAKIQRVQTADFDAFRAFSDGIALFDLTKYQEALQALQKASALDPEFELAKLTFEQYTRLIEKLQARAELLRETEKQSGELAVSQAARQENERLAALWLDAKREGALHRSARLSALFRLALAYDEQSHKGFDELHRTGDRFALARLYDLVVRAYWLEASEAFAEVPPVIAPELGPPLLPPTKNTTATLDAILAQAERTATALQLDALGRAQLFDALYKKGLTLSPAADWRLQFVTDVGSRFADALQFAEASKRYAMASTATKNPEYIERIAAEVALNRDAQRLLEQGNDNPALREYLTFDYARAASSPEAQAHTRALFGPKASASDPAVRAELARLRQLPRRCYNGSVNRDAPLDDYLLLGNRPIWLFGAPYVSTGARSDRWHTDEVRYYLHAQAEKMVLAILDGKPAKQLTLQFEVGFKPPADWWVPLADFGGARTLAEAHFRTERPEVELVFGLVDVDSKPQFADYSGLNRPMKGYGLRLGESEISLVETTEPSREVRCERILRDKVLKQLPVKLAGVDRAAVRVQLEGTVVQVWVNGETARFELPKVALGFYGFVMRGRGFASIGKIGR